MEIVHQYKSQVYHNNDIELIDDVICWVRERREIRGEGGGEWKGCMGGWGAKC